MKCYAKINLFLNIIGKRKDGFHDLVLINDTIDLYDEIYIYKTNEKGIIIKSNVNNSIDKEDNIIYKAAIKFFEYNKINDYGIKIILKKNIPIKGGLGGESTDAAGTLVELNKLYETKMSLEELCDLGLTIGSDVPYCIHKGRCKVTGRGETIKRINDETRLYYVIIKPNFDCSTKEMFNKVKEYTIKKTEYGYNDFEKYIINDIKDIKSDLMHYKPKFTMLTGSGSSVYGAFLNYKNALKCYNKLKDKYNEIFICKSV